MPVVTGLYAALFAFAQIFLTLAVVRRRIGNRVSLGDGGVEDLNRFMRAHGNFVETVPMALVLMMILEMSGTSLWVIHFLGLTMMASRVLHFTGMTTGKGYGRKRRNGMVLTVTVYVVAGILCILHALGIHPFTVNVAL